MKRSTASSAERAVARFDAVFQRVLSDRYTTPASLVRDCVMARTTGYRLLRDLETRGLVSWDENGALMLGDAALRVGLRAHGQGWLDLRALPLLQELRLALGETVFIGLVRPGGVVIEVGPVLTASRRDVIASDGQLEVVSDRPAAGPAEVLELALVEPLPRLLHVRLRRALHAANADADETQVIEVISNALAIPADDAQRLSGPVLMAQPRDRRDRGRLMAALNRCAGRLQSMAAGLAA